MARFGRPNAFRSTIQNYHLWRLIDQSAPLPGAEGVDIANGRVAMSMYGPWGSWYILKDAEFEWDVVPVPQGSEEVVLAWGSTVAMFEGTEHEDEVRQFLEFFLDPERQFQRARD